MKTRHEFSGSVQREIAPPETGQKIGTILVAVDFSDHSKAALRFTNRLAGQLKAKISVVHVVEPLGADDQAAVSATLAHGRDLSETRQALESFSLRELEKEQVVSTQVLIGKPIEQISKAAATSGAEFVVVAGHRDATGVTVLGCSADSLLRQMDRPVLVIPG